MKLLFPGGAGESKPLAPSAVTVCSSPSLLCTLIFAPGLTEADYARLLDAAHRQLGGPIVLVWDHLSTHVGAAMAEIVAARPWLTVFRLPPYAHELNPLEPVWAHPKRSLANLTRHTVAELTALVKTRLKRMQCRPALLAGFLAATGLDFGPVV